MRAHKVKVTVLATHQLIVRLPDDFPPGEAEITVVSRAAEATPANDDFAWLEAWRAALPPAPTVPLETFDRSELYR
jgi:hypothetical protein